MCRVRIAGPAPWLAVGGPGRPLSVALIELSTCSSSNSSNDSSDSCDESVELTASCANRGFFDGVCGSERCVEDGGSGCESAIDDVLEASKGLGEAGVTGIAAAFRFEGVALAYLDCTVGDSCGRFFPFEGVITAVPAGALVVAAPPGGSPCYVSGTIIRM
ncbi:hypothetical protein EDB80DRAFT_707022 [Ilyonectria destructans]|nr:hypothetical protein EDB80DRAFT_707022 [Ilyonectria destructans]